MQRHLTFAFAALASIAGQSACYGASHDRVSEGSFEASDQNPDTCTPADGECISKYHQAPKYYTPADGMRCPHPEDACWIKLERLQKDADQENEK